MRRFRIIFSSILIIAALSICSFAADGGVFRLYNSTISTANPDAAYIQAEITKANGQTIVVKGKDGVVAEKKLPNNGRYCKFRIKIPAYAVKDKGVTSFAVTALNAKGEEFNTSFARVRVLERKQQEIDVPKAEYDVKLPGDIVKINASVSSEKPLSYTSSDESIVKVDEEGNIEPVGGGTAEITVSQTNDSEYEDASKTVKVSVEEVPYYTVRLHLGKDAPKTEEDSDEADADTEEASEEEGEEGSTSLMADDSVEVEGDADDIIVEQKIAIGDTTQLLAAADKKGDYEFLGWATTRTGYPEYDNSQEVENLAENKETVDLYAVWHGERAQGAVEWGEMIAADNRFTYGKGYKGYFDCPVCAGRYGPSDAQYTCMPFCAACYAHGAEDPIMLRGGEHVMNLHNGNFSGELGEVWEKVGLCKNLTIDDLRPGDIVIKYAANNSSGHAWMYGGGDEVVEAVPSDIRVKSGAAAKLSRYGHSEGNTSMNYVMRYKY